MGVHWAMAAVEQLCKDHGPQHGVQKTWDALCSTSSSISYDPWALTVSLQGQTSQKRGMDAAHPLLSVHPFPPSGSPSTILPIEAKRPTAPHSHQKGLHLLLGSQKMNPALAPMQVQCWCLHQLGLSTQGPCRWCRPDLSHARGTARLGCPSRTNCLCLPPKLCNVSNFSPEKGHAQLPIWLPLRMETSDFPFTLAGNLPPEPCQDREREALSIFHRIRSWGGLWS